MNETSCYKINGRIFFKHKDVPCKRRVMKTLDNIVGTLGLIVTKKVLQHMLHICHMRILWKL